MKRAGLYIRMSTAGSAPRNSIARSAPIRRPAWASHCRDLHGSRGKRDERSPSCAGQADGRCTATQIRCRGRLAVRPSGEVNQALLQVLDELHGFGIQFLSQREAIDTEGPLGRAIIVIISAIAKLESSPIVEIVRVGMRRAKLEGWQIGRARLDIKREQVVEDRRSRMSLTVVAKRHAISRASMCRLMKEFNGNSPAEEVLRSGRNTVAQVSL